MIGLQLTRTFSFLLLVFASGAGSAAPNSRGTRVRGNHATKTRARVYGQRSTVRENLLFCCFQLCMMIFDQIFAMCRRPHTFACTDHCSNQNPMLLNILMEICFHHTNAFDRASVARCLEWIDLWYVVHKEIIYECGNLSLHAKILGYLLLSASLREVDQ